MEPKMATLVESIINFLTLRATEKPLDSEQLTSLVSELRGQINQLSVADPAHAAKSCLQAHWTAVAAWSAGRGYDLQFLDVPSLLYCPSLRHAGGKSSTPFNTFLIPVAGCVPRSSR
jgi:hypothetical protein